MLKAINFHLFIVGEGHTPPL